MYVHVYVASHGMMELLSCLCVSVGGLSGCLHVYLSVGVFVYLSKLLHVGMPCSTSLSFLGHLEA